MVQSDSGYESNYAPYRDSVLEQTTSPHLTKFDANLHPEEDLLSILVQKVNSINGMRQLNHDF